MKQLVKAVTTKQQRHDLCLKRDRWVAGAGSLLGAAANCLPGALRVFLKERLRVVRPMDYASSRIVLDIASSLENNIRTRSCAKEPETVAWIEKYFHAGDVFWDIGANVGAYSLVAAKCHRGAVPVYAIEPSFLNFAQLCRNIALNGCGDIITPLNLALSETTCISEFNYQNFISGGALHNLGEAVDFKNEAFVPVFRQRIPSFSVDDLVRILKVPVPNHIKLDVDGIESAIMRGASVTLADHKLRSILVELSDRDKPLVELLGSYGFIVREKHLAGHEDWNLYNCILTR